MNKRSSSHKIPTLAAAVDQIPLRRLLHYCRTQAMYFATCGQHSAAALARDGCELPQLWYSRIPPRPRLRSSGRSLELRRASGTSPAADGPARPEAVSADRSLLVLARMAAELRIDPSCARATDDPPQTPSEPAATPDATPDKPAPARVAASVRAARPVSTSDVRFAHVREAP